MEAIRALADEIGARPPCSAAEGRAAEWCAARLSELGYEVGVEEFFSRRSYVPWFIAYLTVALVAAALIPVFPLGALSLGIAAVVLHGRDAEGRPAIRPRSATSRNVVARSRSGGPIDVVVVAHMDSARSSPSFHPRMVGGLRMSTLFLNGTLMLVPAAAAAAWFFDGGDAGVVAASILLGLYLLFAIVLLAWGLRMPLVPGANDNATGVEVLLRMAAARPDARVAFVVTGSEESGMLGIQAFLERHAEIATATFVNIDSVGAGRLIAASDEGVLRTRRPPSALLDLAEKAGAPPHPFRGMPTDATALMSRGRAAVSLLAVDDREVIPNWHWPTDTSENVNPAVVDRADEVAQRLVRTLLETRVAPASGPKNRQ